MPIDIKAIFRDGKEQLQLQCPGCKTWGDVDHDQIAGLVSCVCPKCGAHWTTESDTEINVEVETE